MNKDQLIDLLKKYHLSPNFTYGQNFLIDDFVLQDIIDAAEVGKGDAVLEIGPGIGNLTRLLCQRAGFVLAIEKDPKFLPILKAIKKDYPENFRYEIADALEYNFQEVFAGREEGRGKRVGNRPSPITLRPYKVVANIPYFITGKILKMVLAARPKPKSITLLTQKEVAQNIIAPPGKLSILGISVQIHGTPQIVQIVPGKSFYPAPKVDSAIIHIVPYGKIPYGILDEKKFFSVVKASFAGKRKQLHNTVASNLKISKEAAVKILAQAKINPSSRPQELSIEDWIRLVKTIEQNSKK